MTDPDTRTDLHATAEAPMRTAVILPWRAEGQMRDATARLAEAVELARSIGLEVVHTATVTLRAPQPATLLGTGQVASLGAAMAAAQAGLVVVDAALTPVQQRNLEREWHCKVIDRTGLILDIFGERARTREGALQVELAHLQYQRSRLVRSWTHLGRQRGGFGFLGGPGETQIEADRRLIDDRIVRLRHEIEDLRRTRGLHRAARQRMPAPVVALVGYTNAGKSTLFNALTGAETFAENQLFATLDPTMRGLDLPSGRKAILSDTVGFISALPTELVAAFRATLEEVAEADVILHVRDVAHPDSQAQRADVIAVLDGMVRDGTLDADWPRRSLEVLNKADLLGGVARAGARPGEIAVSALTGEGLPALRGAIDTRLSEGMVTAGYDIPVSSGAQLAWLYGHGEVIGRQDTDDSIHVTVRLSPDDRARFERQHLPSADGTPER
ncbi:GTPase HflX [Siccirubricoccus deserti]|uniref:GTPase HflX n=1 Tax=Siccirubricoccus deserti TaxID=2013562 RepID=A0A9X0R2L7_9PROT|nr:GTPase HflX [Siccirubricoccus deserti]GGC64667.1 GTPase HflX [Siccirubricoccus deserti]